MALTLCFVRFALYLNLTLSLLWLVLTVIPFLVRPPVTFRWNQFGAYSAKNVIKGFGLDNSFLVYGALPSPHACPHTEKLHLTVDLCVCQCYDSKVRISELEQCIAAGISVCSSSLTA